MLSKQYCQWSVITVAVLLFGLAVTGMFYVPVGLNEQVSMEVDSDLYDYFTYMKKFI